MKRPLLLTSRAGMTLVELLVAGAVSSMIFCSLIAGTVALRRAIDAADYHVTAQNEQLRITDYLGRDLRTGSNVAVVNSGARVNVSRPVDDSGSLAVHLELPLLGSLQVGDSSGSSQSISYYREGDRFIREVNGVQTEIARTVSSFRASRTGSMLEVTLTFSPKFSKSSAATSQNATQLTTRIFLRNSPG